MKFSRVRGFYKEQIINFWMKSVENTPPPMSKGIITRLQYNLKSFDWILMKFLGGFGGCTRNK